MLGLSLGIGWTGTARYEGTFVFTLIGQSNMVGRAAFDGGSTHPSGTLQWGRTAPNDGVAIPATHPLDHHDPNAGDMGLDISFARGWAAMYPGAELMLVPSADGGTSLSSGAWQKGGTLFEDAVARTNAAMAAFPEATFAGFLWHQGESDEGNAAYQTQLDQMIADFRGDVLAADATTPFVLGALSPDWVAGVPGREAIQATILDTPNRVGHTAVASSAGLTGPGSALHFDAAGLRTLGTRYVTALGLAQAGQGGVPMAVTTIPDQTDYIETGSGSGPQPPQAVGTVPDQTDELAA